MTNSQPLIYCVDDSADYRLLMGLVFQRVLTQYNVQFFESGTELCERLGSVAIPSLLLMDYTMPGLSGPQTLSRLRQHPHWQSVPAVIVSSSTLPSDEQAAMAAGAVSYMIKPMTLDVMTRQLTYLCQQWAAGRLPKDPA